MGIGSESKESEKKTLNGLVMKYFILKPKGHSAHAKASRAAIEAYAFEIGDENPKLASELREWSEKERRAEI